VSHEPDTIDAERELTERRQLERTWAIRSGLVGWLTTTNHKEIAKRYVVTAFAFFIFAGVEALMMRLQLARPKNTLLGPDQYNQVFTMHGTTMMFLFAVPIMEAIGLYLVPLMVGTRNVAFPRLNAYGYLVYVSGGILLYVSFLLGIGPDAGWFAYVPLSGPEFSPGKRVDHWAQMITFTEIAALVGGVEIVVTTFKMRAPGMSLNRIPLFVWAQVVAAFMIIFGMPAVMLDSSMLASDRLISTHFFNPAEGGDAILYQHLFWFFGHPEVYIIFVPALGFVSTIIATFSRRPVVGYTAMVLSLIATGFIGFGLWVHHMFATNIPQLGESFFTAASMMIAIPTGIQIFCWIATLWTGRLDLRTPLLFVLGFFGIFVLGGITGVTLAAVPFDLQAHDTYYVVAHFHYVLVGGAVFPLFAAIFYWFPKVTGRMLSETAGRWTFWLMFVGFNVAFLPMHLLGLYGMPRRVYTYLPDMGWSGLNLTASAGGVVIALGVAVFVCNLLWSWRFGLAAGDNPWGASTLEWATSSPPPPYNFAFPPTVDGRTPLWTRAPEATPAVVGLRTDCREVLCTTVLDAEPDHRYDMAGDSIWPLALAFATAVAFVGVIFTSWAIPVGALCTFLALFGWFWQGTDPHKIVSEDLESKPTLSTAPRPEPVEEQV
jgi:cytochrome c oxidase subunit 1